jgi:hypothetical protein
MAALGLILLAACGKASAQNYSLEQIVTPSTVILKDGKPVLFAVHGFIEFKSLSEAFLYIESQKQRWAPDGLLAEEGRQALAHALLREAIESRVVSMVDERPQEAVVTHTADELKRAIAKVKEPMPPGYAEAFLQVQDKWQHSLNCWSASPSIQGRVLSNWYPIEEGIPLYGATYDSTEHFWQAVKYHPDVTVAQLMELLEIFGRKDWKEWLSDLDEDPGVYLQNAYAIEFLRHNLAAERLQWFRDQLRQHGLHATDHPRQVQQREANAFRFSAFEEKTLWGDLADLFHLVYVFSPPTDTIRIDLADRHFDGIYLEGQRMKFISQAFRSLMLEIWKVKFLQMVRFREVIASIPREIKLSHFLNDGDSPDIPIPVYVDYLSQIRKMAIEAKESEAVRPRT